MDYCPSNLRCFAKENGSRFDIVKGEDTEAFRLSLVDLDHRSKRVRIAEGHGG